MTHRSLRRGFALMAALALLLTISIVALDMTLMARPPRLAAAVATERIAAMEAAMAGVEHARATLLLLADPDAFAAPRHLTRAGDPWSVADGLVLGPMPMGQLAYRVDLRDAGARLQVNVAGEPELRRLFLALRLDARRADRLAAAIADWRDTDQLRRANGAEAPEYLRTGRAVPPDDHPFANIAALRFVVGMTDSLYDVMRGSLTVAGSGRINLNAADRPVLMTLPGMTEESASRLLGYRRSGRRVTDLYRFGDELSSGARQRWREALPHLAAMTVLETREIHATSIGWQPAGVTRVRIDAIISLDAEGRVTWRRVSP